jgi:hypothetical protein
LHKPKRRDKLTKIRHEKHEVERLIALTAKNGNAEKHEKFLARWHALCSEELRAMAETAKARKSAAA